MFAPFCQMLIWDFDAAVPSIIAMSLLLVWRHSANIGAKLLAGTEAGSAARRTRRADAGEHRCGSRAAPH